MPRRSARNDSFSVSEAVLNYVGCVSCFHDLFFVRVGMGVRGGGVGVNGKDATRSYFAVSLCIRRASEKHAFHDTAGHKFGSNPWSRLGMFQINEAQVDLAFPMELS